MNRNMAKKRTHTSDSTENVEPKLQKLIPNSVSNLGLSKHNATICNMTPLPTKAIVIENHQMKKSLQVGPQRKLKIQLPRGNIEN